MKEQKSFVDINKIADDTREVDPSFYQLPALKEIQGSLRKDGIDRVQVKPNKLSNAVKPSKNS